MTINTYISQIAPSDQKTGEEAQKHLDSLAKPPGSLGELEVIARKICAITGSLHPKIEKKVILVLAADNGVVEEGVSCTPQSVTAKQTVNMLRGVTGVGVLAGHYGIDLMVADVGICTNIKYPGLIQEKIRLSTGNITREPAMERQEAERAILVGIRLVKEAAQRGYEVIGTGEMGIGNTTTSSAVLAALLGKEENQIEEVIGRGGGLTEEGFLRKREVIRKAVKFHQPDRSDPIDVLCKVGGLDLAAMTGVYLGAAYCRLPVVIDGFISITAALCAVRLCPAVADYLFASHSSAERGYQIAAEELSIRPSLAMGMRLGEGSGCPLFMGLMDAAMAVYERMATFAEAEIDDSYLNPIRD